jgi:NAD(P)-dependent dehydrogenase (short-subunit alcohol dehydrogenase family)
LGEYDINVNCVSPGYIQRGDYNEITLDWLKDSNYMKKVGTIEDIANAVLFLASDESIFITGQNLIVDGGRSLGLKGAE